MKQELTDEVVEHKPFEVVQNTLHSLTPDLPKLVIDLHTLKGTASKQAASSTPIAYFESGDIDYLKQVTVLRKYIENLPELLKTELRDFIPPLCVFLYHELRQRQSKEIYINFLAKVVELKILPNANEVDNEQYFNTKHVVSISRQTYEHLMEVIGNEEWLSVLSVINQKFVFDIKKESKAKQPESKPLTSLQKACSNLELGLAPAHFSFVKTLKITNTTSALCMTVSPDNRTLLVGASDSVIYKWELAGCPASQVPPATAKPAPNAPLPNPDIKLFYDDRFTVEGGESSKLYAEMRGHAGPVYRIDIHRVEQCALSASHDATIILWCLKTDTMLYKYSGHAKWPVYHVTFSPVSTYFASSSHDTTAKLWRTDHTAPVRIFAGHSGPVTCCEFHPNGNYLVTAGEDVSCRLWDVSSGNCARVIPLKCYITALAVSPNGKVVVCALQSGNIVLWDIATTKIIRQYETETTPQTNGYHSADDVSHKLVPNTISDLMFVHENSVVSGDYHGNVLIWDTRLHSKLHSKPVDRVNVGGRVKGLSSNKAGLIIVGVL